MINDHQRAYYHALEQADQLAESTPFIHFMLSVIARTLAQNAALNASLNATVNVAGLKTPDAILMLLQDNAQLTRNQIAGMLGKDMRTIARAMSKLQQAGSLTRIGSDKAGHGKGNSTKSSA